MKIAALLLACFAIGRLQADPWSPSQDLLRQVRHIESADGRYTVGDQGRSLGDYQISEAAWCDVNAWRKARGQRTFNYSRHVWSESVSRAYAADYLKILHAQLEKRLGRSPSLDEVYAAYNMGLSSFAKRQYRVTTPKLNDPAQRPTFETAFVSR